MKIFILIFCLFFSNFLNAETINNNEQDYVIDEDARVRESTDELIVREITIDPETHPGNALYHDNCAICHDGSIQKAPAVNWLEMLIPQALFRTMNDGIMAEQSAHLSEEEKLKCRALKVLLPNFTFSFPKKLTSCSIILPETALICAFDLIIL